MQITSDLKELSKQKCSTKGCKNRAECIIKKVVYCNYCIKNPINKESEWWTKLINKK